MNRGKLVVISGPAGIGKGTVCKELLRREDSLALSVSWTTRDIRKDEVEGVTYFYRTEEQFEEMIRKNGFLEYAGKFGNHYGTPRDYVYQKLDEGKNVILEIEMQGALNVMRSEKDVTSIYLLPPSMQVLKDRLIDRGRESKEKALKRFAEAVQEIELATKYNYVLVNDDLETTVQNILSIIFDLNYQNPQNIPGMIQKLKEEKTL